MPEDKTEHQGHIPIYSGRLLFVDEVIIQDLPIAADQYIIIDIEKENVQVPLVATNQGGQRFLIIPIDQATPLPMKVATTVEVTDQVEIPSPDDEAKKHAPTR